MQHASGYIIASDTDFCPNFYLNPDCDANLNGDLYGNLDPHSYFHAYPNSYSYSHSYPKTQAGKLAASGKQNM